MGLYLSFLFLLSLAWAAKGQPRPSLVNERIRVRSFRGNGHTMSLDGRLVISNVGEDELSMTTSWRALVMRPERIRYNNEGKPSFDDYVMSIGMVDIVGNGENALAMCFPRSEEPFYLNEYGDAVYELFVYDSRMYPNVDPLYAQFRRRRIRVIVQYPFTKDAEIYHFDAGGEELEYLTTVDGMPVFGIEPTITSDGRLMVFQGHPSNNGKGDYLMYTYNPDPCAVHNWTVPLPIHLMSNDTDLQEYPIAWNKLKAATGEEYTDTEPLRGAYAWIDAEGRDLLYTAVRNLAGKRREAVSFIGADTKWTAYNIDGGTNSKRYEFSKLFYSSPMWNLERDRHSSQNPLSTSNWNHFLPVTNHHDVIPLFGSNTRDYTEIDIGDLTDPFQILNLPMNEMVTRGGEYNLWDLTPDLSGFFATGKLIGDAYTTWNTTLASSSTGSLLEPHSKGRALVMNERLGHRGGLRSFLAPDTPGVNSTLAGFSLQMIIRPHVNISEQECYPNSRRHLLHIPDALTLFYHWNHTLELKIKINDKWLRLGSSDTMPLSKWSHVAYSWDGVSGSFVEYVNGVSSGRTLKRRKGLFTLGSSREVFVGTASYTGKDDPLTCSNFMGAVDEVRLYSHARSGRSICRSTYGTNCIETAIKDEPSSGQNILSHQRPDCDNRESISSMACQSALHRVCAQKGAVGALSSTGNILGTVKQLISSRPPISLGGVVTSEQDGVVTVACVPLSQESIAVTFEELTREQRGCRHDRHADSIKCVSATKRFCDSIGWDTGLIVEVTSRAWIVCFNAHKIEDVEEFELGGNCREEAWTGVECKLRTSEWCQQSGYDAGIIQEVFNNTVAKIHCFDGYLLDEFRFKPADET